MPGVGKIEHTPECSVGIWFTDLKERKIRRVGRWEGEFVDGGDDTCIGDGPFEIPGSFTANYARC